MNTLHKILSLPTLRSRLDDARAHSTIVLANGIFDLLHVGHIRYLEAARREGDLLVVAINSDSSARLLKGPGRPILPESARARLVAALRAVNFVTIFPDPNVESLLESLRPHVHAKGTDYSADTVPERAVAARLAIRVAIVGDPKSHSTSALLVSLRNSPAPGRRDDSNAP